MIYEGSVKGPHVLQPIVPVAVTMVTQPRPGLGCCTLDQWPLVWPGACRGRGLHTAIMGTSILIFRSDN